MRSDEWDRAYAACESTWPVQPHPHVEEELADLPPGRAVELGCGEGRQAIWLAARGWQMTAVDFSPVRSTVGAGSPNGTASMSTGWSRTWSATARRPPSTWR